MVNPVRGKEQLCWNTAAFKPAVCQTAGHEWVQPGKTEPPFRWTKVERLPWFHDQITFRQTREEELQAWRLPWNTHIFTTVDFKMQNKIWFVYLLSLNTFHLCIQTPCIHTAYVKHACKKRCSDKRRGMGKALQWSLWYVRSDQIKIKGLLPGFLRTCWYMFQVPRAWSLYFYQQSSHVPLPRPNQIHPLAAIIWPPIDPASWETCCRSPGVLLTLLTMKQFNHANVVKTKILRGCKSTCEDIKLYIKAYIFKRILHSLHVARHMKSSTFSY